MELTFAPKGRLQIDDCKIIFRNFSGAPSAYNREGDRNFSLRIEDEEIANALMDEGWNVKIKPARNEDEDVFMHMKVKVVFNDYGPEVYLITNGIKNRLSAEDIGCLDRIDIERVDMDIRPYDWNLADGKSGRTAYLDKLYVVQRLDRFADRYAEEESPSETPWD